MIATGQSLYLFDLVINPITKALERSQKWMILDHIMMIVACCGHGLLSQLPMHKLVRAMCQPVLCKWWVRNHKEGVLCRNHMHHPLSGSPPGGGSPSNQSISVSTLRCRQSIATHNQHKTLPCKQRAVCSCCTTC